MSPRGWARRARGVTAWDAADEALRTLALQVLEDALVTLSRGPLVPFAVVEVGDEAQLHPLGTDLEACRAWLRELPDEIERAVLAYPGDVTLYGERFDVVFVEAHELRLHASAKVGQRYGYRPGEEPVVIGTVFDAGDGPALLVRT